MMNNSVLWSMSWRWHFVGFPLVQNSFGSMLKKILRAGLGNTFPEDGLGKNWATRFITKHHGKIGMYERSTTSTMN